MAMLSDMKAKNIKPDDGPIADGTVSGLRLHPGEVKGHGKWLMRFKSPTEFIKNKALFALSVGIVLPFLQQFDFLEVCHEAEGIPEMGGSG